MKIIEENKRKFKVIGKRVETHDVVTLTLSPNDKRSFSCRAGQYINVYFPEKNIATGKAYSISSPLKNRSFEITVKSIGEFSNALCDMRVGQEILASDPYGYFYSEEESTDLVLIASGIGVAPFRNMIHEVFDNSRQESKDSSPRKVFLFVSNKTKKDIIFRKEFDDLISKYKNIKIINYITREKVLNKDALGIFEGRIKINKIIDTIKDPLNTEFLICGSISFVRDMRIGLKNSGIPENAIYTEAFFSH